MMQIIEMIRLLPKGTILYADVVNLGKVELVGVDGSKVLVRKVRDTINYYTFGVDDCGAAYSLMRLLPARNKKWSDMEYLYIIELEDADGNTLEVECVAMPRIDGDITLYLDNGEEVIVDAEEFGRKCRKV